MLDDANANLASPELIASREIETARQAKAQKPCNRILCALAGMHFGDCEFAESVESSAPTGTPVAEAERAHVDPDAATGCGDDALPRSFVEEAKEWLEAERAPQFTDRERLDWLVKGDGSIGFSSGDREPDSWIKAELLRSSLDAAMLAAGLQPQERERVTMAELVRVSYGASMKSMEDARIRSIRSILAAVRASDGSLKEVIE